MFRDLCSVRIFILPHRFRLRLVSLFDLVLSLEFANQLFPQSYDSCLHSRSAPFPSPLSSQSSPLGIRLDILNVFFTISSIHSNPSPPCLSAVSTFVFASISSMSSLQYRRYILIRLLPLFLLSRLHFVFVSISSMSLQYRRYALIRSLHVSPSSQSSPPCIRVDIHVNVFTISSIHSNLFPLSQPSPPCTRLDTDVNVFLTISTIHSPIPLLSLILISVFNSLHFRRQFSTFISPPSSMYPRIRSYLLLILLGSLSVPLRSIHLSPSSPMSLRRPHPTYA